MKQKTLKLTIACLVLAACSMAGAKENESHNKHVIQHDPCPVQNECGYVTSIEKIEQIAESNGVGTAAGALGGALLGKSMSDSSIGMILGGVAGAAVGNYAQRKIQAEDIYVIHVKFKNGQAGESKVKEIPSYKVNQQIRVRNGKVIWAGQVDQK